MPEGLQTPAGDKVELDHDFAAAMAAPESDEPIATAPPRRDREAPYGRKLDGSPKAGPGGRPARSKDDKARVTSTPSGAKAESKEDAHARRVSGVSGLVQAVSIAPLMMYQRTQGKAWQADVITLTSSADPLAQACADTAEVSPSFAKLVDSVSNVGPYTALVSVGLGIGAQLLANHGVAIGRALGATNPDELIAEFEKATDAGDPS
jgi:hypothetical protein